VSKAIVVRKAGGPEVMKLEERDLPPPGPGEVRVKHEAIGLNFLDVYHRSGQYPVEAPFVPGSEAAGVVTAVGPEVGAFKLGDRVCCRGPMGTYCEERNVAANRLLPVPDGISSEIAAATTLKGLTALYLLEMTWPVKKGETILFHAAAGGVGQIAVQWAKALGARVIGAVGSDDKEAIAKKLGCDEVINIRAVPDYAPIVAKMTGGRGVDVVYDSIGRDTFERSLDCLRPRGLMVSFGSSSGPVSIADLGILAAKGSLYLTRPTPAHYFADRQVELASAARVFEMIGNGTVKISIGQTFALADAAKAHEALASRHTTGSSVLVP